MEQPISQWTVRVDADTEPLRNQLDRVAVLGQRFGRTLTRSLEGAVLRGRNLGDVLKSLGQRLSQLALQAAFKPLEDGLGSLFTNLVSQGLPAIASAVGGGGVPVPFAAGGVVAAPTYFALSGGRTGVMGERGAEAILPLKRGPDGSLGVGAEAGNHTVITFNVAAPDAESFVRSETQIAAMLSRLVTRGGRNL